MSPTCGVVRTRNGAMVCWPLACRTMLSGAGDTVFLQSGPNSFVFHHWRLWACFVSLPHRHGRNRECFPKGYGGIFSLQCQVVVALDDWLCLPAKLVSPVHFYVLHTRVNTLIENCASQRFNGSNKLGLLDVDRGSGGGDCRHDHRCDQSHHGGQSAGTQ